ncbi:DUF1330 domain-containing protein [Arenicella sp.]|nr:DUF1330 domain-containing protein [Arenicella sp.]
MSVYVISRYDITDHEKFDLYVPGVIPVLEKYQAKVVAADENAITVDGESSQVNVIMKFPTAELVTQLYEDPEYQYWLQVRLECTTNRLSVILNEFDQTKHDKRFEE